MAPSIPNALVSPPLPLFPHFFSNNHLKLDLCLLIPRGSLGRKNTPPSHPILAGPRQLIPPNSDCLQLFLHTTSPRLPWLSHFPLSLRVPAKCLSCCICCRLPKSMANPSPLPSLYFCNKITSSTPCHFK